MAAATAEQCTALAKWNCPNDVRCLEPFSDCERLLVGGYRFVQLRRIGDGECVRNYESFVCVFALSLCADESSCLCGGRPLRLSGSASQPAIPFNGLRDTLVMCVPLLCVCPQQSSSVDPTIPQSECGQSTVDHNCGPLRDTLTVSSVSQCAETVPISSAALSIPLFCCLIWQRAQQ